MRTGSEYREALRDGRRVWVIGEGLIEDVTVHPATRPMVEKYVAWYDRHRYTALANSVLRALALDMPSIDLDGLRNVAMPQRRPVVPPSPPGPGKPA